MAGFEYSGMLRVKIVALMAFVFLTISGSAQKNNLSLRHINQRSFGMMVHYGHYFYSLPEGYVYRPLLMGFTLHLPVSQTRKNFNYGVDFVPQVGFSYTNKLNTELGLNIYINANQAITQNTLLSFNVGAGPHYTDLETSRQAKGFIFSSNFLVSLKHRSLYQGKYFEFGMFSGLRHISNAQFRKPNIGINNLMFGVSITRLF